MEMKLLRTVFFALLLAIITSVIIMFASEKAKAQSANVTDGINFSGCPQFKPFDIEYLGQRNLITICRINYAVIYDTTCKIPVMTFERLRPEDIDGDAKRYRNFLYDPTVDRNMQGNSRDYRKSGYDRGHMVASANMRENSASQKQTFYFTNIVPQFPKFNRGSWKTIENQTRNFINQNVDTYVVTGAIANGKDIIGNNVCVPQIMWKYVLPTDDHQDGIYFVNANINSRKNALNTDLTDIQLLSQFKWTF